MSHADHSSEAVSRVGPIGCAVITVSDTRTEATDASGAIIRQLLAEAGHRVVRYAIVPDEAARITAFVDELARDAACSAILMTGGTGISSRDRTYEAVVACLDRRLDGFGELFRYLSFVHIGPAAMLSRAVAGLCRGRVVFVMPGSPGAVRLAMTRLILPELAHIVWELSR
ncbi:MAG: MogA/MoaB family molybdenum cofactor biosynthesis protein [Phycisphaerae bacterium]